MGNQVCKKIAVALTAAAIAAVVPIPEIFTGRPAPPVAGCGCLWGYPSDAV